MRVLMVAPEPVLSPRGTPISVSNRCRALSALGHDVDLVTYPIGEDFDAPGLRILRAPAIPGIRRVKIGPSVAKLPLDALVFLRAAAQMLRQPYDVVHTHEEAGAFGWWAHRLTGIPHLHDMHNDLAMVLTNYGIGEKHPLTRFASWLEKRIVRSAEVVIVVFPELGNLVQKYVPGKSVHLIHNSPLDPPADPAAAAALRRAWAVDGEPLVVYTGTLEPYQGIPLLIDAFARVAPAPNGTRPRLVIVGGRPAQVSEVRAMAVAAGIADRVTLPGLRPPEEIPACLAAADILVSTRSSGSNTPLKLYAYLHSGRPIVATRISSHLQVLDATTALLVDPTAAAIALGIDTLIADPELGARLGAAAARRGASEYSPRVFLQRTAAAYASLGAPLPDDAALDRIQVALAKVA